MNSLSEMYRNDANGFPLWKKVVAGMMAGGECTLFCGIARVAVFASHLWFLFVNNWHFYHLWGGGGECLSFCGIARLAVSANHLWFRGHFSISILEKLCLFCPDGRR
jgi:hypothetical protein